MKLYEGMFLLDSSQASKDKGWDAVTAHVHAVLERHGAQIVKSNKWGERKLAYEIARQKRGTYMLVHFNAEGAAIGRIRRDTGLSDIILRALILVDADHDDTHDVMGEDAVDRRDDRRRNDSRDRPPRNGSGSKPEGAGQPEEATTDDSRDELDATNVEAAAEPEGNSE